MLQDLLQRFLSRKFLLALLNVFVAFGLELSDAQLAAITAAIIAFIAAEGAADFVSRK